MERIIKCPVCKTTTCVVTSYKEYCNDYGGVIIRLDKCNHLFPLPTPNPQDVRVKGGKVLDCWDNDIPSNKEDILRKHGIENDVVPLEILHFISDSEPEDLTYDFEAHSLFVDQINNVDYEQIAYRELRSYLVEIQRQYAAYLSIYLKGRQDHPKHIYLIINLPDNNKAFFYRKFSEEINFKEKIEENILADIKDFNLADSIDGTFSKSDSLSILRKCIQRWNIMFQRVLVVTPFVGHLYTKRADRFALWESLLNHLLPQKTTLLTKREALNKFKELLKENDLDLNLLNEFDLRIPVIEDSVKKQDFHAKFYAGISEDNTEVLSGSVNIVEGPSIENFSFKKLETHIFNERYLKNMKIDPFTFYDKKTDILLIYTDNEDVICGKLEHQHKDATEILQKYYK